jgi:carbon monoxide dehydrogenase subunit G
MATYDTSIPSTWSVGETFEYVAAFSNAAEWDPGVSRGKALQEGPARMGAVYRLEIPVTGFTATFEYRIVELDRPHKVVLLADHPIAISTDTITVEPSTLGSLVRYHAVLEPRGLFRLLGPLFNRTLRRIGDRAADGLRARLT